ncbi:MAG: type I-C CRISPR-associated protein Cas8c/Csd1 [Lachnospiraceae bacterium]
MGVSMLLQSLLNYYEILAEEENSTIPKLGYGRAKVSYALTISRAGELVGVLPLKRPDASGKKQIALELDVPEQVKRTVGVAANFLCDNASYVLGMDNKGNEKRSKECFEAFKLHNQTVLQEVVCEEARAVCRFLEQWKTEEAKEHPKLIEYLEDICKGANLVFRLEGMTGYVHQESSIRHAWEAYKDSSADGETRTCLVTGKYGKIALLHPSIRGIRGGQPMGNTLVSFNAPAYESYGNTKAQGLNAPVSEYAAFAYGAALNYMLSDSSHRMLLGDSTIVYWAECEDNKEYQDIFALMNNPDELIQISNGEQHYVRDPVAVEEVKSIFTKLANGTEVSGGFSVKEDARFYILALSPNAARISIRFMLSNQFGVFIDMLKKHHENMTIEKQFEKEPEAISIWRMLNETVAPSSTNKAASALLSGSVMRAIFTGSAYPTALFQAIMIRIRAEKEINYVKAAIIKAYLSRSTHAEKYKKEGVLEMSLNTQSQNKAYVLGRLFAALEKAQKDANPTINKTIKDRYFTSACANPAQIFPVLLKLSNYHIAKAEYGARNEAGIEEIMQLLKVEENPFPKNLTLENQGIFVLGYYHQRNKHFTDIKEASERKKEKANNRMEE